MDIAELWTVGLTEDTLTLFGSLIYTTYLYHSNSLFIFQYVFLPLLASSLFLSASRDYSFTHCEAIFFLAISEPLHNFDVLLTIINYNSYGKFKEQWNT